MIALAIPATVALVLALVLTPMCRAFCLRCGWVDRPDARKLHCSPIPRAGGIGIFAAYAAGAGASHAWAILPAVCAAFGIGLLYDIVNVRPWMKIGGQFLAAVLLCFGVPVGAWWHAPLMIVWVVGCANAVNLIDGLDGLAAGIGLLATAAAFLQAMLTGNVALAAVTAPLIGALLGFLPYNFNPASIFMGDCGSNTIGFLLGCFTILWWRTSHTVWMCAAPAMVLTIPILDTALAVLRRFVWLKPIFAADRGHIHHRLLDRGFDARRVACMLYAGGGLCACLSILLSINAAVVLAAFGIVVCLGLRYLRYDEFRAVRRVIGGGVLRRVLAADLALGELENAIAAAGTIEECWLAVYASGQSLGLSHASMQVYGRKFLARFDEDAAAKECWSLRVLLEGVGVIDLEIPFDVTPAGAAELANSLRNVLGSRLEALRPKLALAAAASAGRRR